MVHKKGRVYMYLFVYYKHVHTVHLESKRLPMIIGPNPQDPENWFHLTQSIYLIYFWRMNCTSQNKTINILLLTLIIDFRGDLTNVCVKRLSQHLFLLLFSHPKSQAKSYLHKVTCISFIKLIMLRDVSLEFSPGTTKTILYISYYELGSVRANGCPNCIFYNDLVTWDIIL